MPKASQNIGEGQSFVDDLKRNGSMVDALELSDDEGRGKLRKAEIRSKHPLYSQIAEWGNPAVLITVISR